MQIDRIDNAISQVAKLYTESSSDNQQKILGRLEMLFNTLNGVNESRASREKKKRHPPEILNIDILNCPAYIELENRDLIRRTHVARLSIAQVIARELKLNISREERRNKYLLIAWYNTHLEAILPVLDQLELIFEENNN